MNSNEEGKAYTLATALLALRNMGCIDAPTLVVACTTVITMLIKDNAPSEQDALDHITALAQDIADEVIGPVAGHA